MPQIFVHSLRVNTEALSTQQRNLLQALVRRRSYGLPVVCTNDECPNEAGKNYILAQFGQESIERILADLKSLIPDAEPKVQRVRTRSGRNGGAEATCTCKLAGARGSVPDYDEVKRCPRHYDPKLDEHL